MTATDLSRTAEGPQEMVVPRKGAGADELLRRRQQSGVGAGLVIEQRDGISGITQPVTIGSPGGR